MNVSHDKIQRFTDDLMEKINEIRSTPVQDKIQNLVAYFTYLREKGTLEEIFSELTFCILAANFNAYKSMEIQRELGNKVLEISKSELIRFLREKKHRFPEKRAEYIVKARSQASLITSLIRSQLHTHAIREWLFNNLDGVGMKVASHFLRNTGRFDVAILDYHILDLLERHDIIVRPRNLTIKKYLEIEKIIFQISENLKIYPGILDLYLWYMETGHIVK